MLQAGLGWAQAQLSSRLWQSLFHTVTVVLSGAQHTMAWHGVAQHNTASQHSVLTLPVVGELATAGDLPCMLSIQCVVAGPGASLQNREVVCYWRLMPSRGTFNVGEGYEFQSHYCACTSHSRKSVPTGFVHSLGIELRTRHTA